MLKQNNWSGTHYVHGDLCSGCITSSKTVMLEKKSLDEFLSNINKGKAVIVSVSPQSRASLGVAFGLSPLQASLFSYVVLWIAN